MSRSITLRCTLALIFAALLVSVPSFALRAPDELDLPADFDHRVPAATLAEDGLLAQVREETEAAFRERFGRELVVHFGHRSTRPHLVLREDGPLVRLPDGDVEDALRALLAREVELFGLTGAEIEALETTRSYRTADTRVLHLELRQRVGGIPVFEGLLRVNVDAEGGVLNIGGEWFPSLVPATTPGIDAGAALSIAAQGIGLSGNVPPIETAGQGPERETVFAETAEFAAPPRAGLVLVPQQPGQARLAWEVMLQEGVSGGENLYRVLVDAASGEPLLRTLLTYYVADPADATGLVFEKDPEAGPQVERSFAGDPVASPEHWVTAGQTETRGNNIIARRDWGGRNDDEVNPLADGGDTLEFHFPFTDRWASGRMGDSDAAITNAFYLGNVYHDYYYDLGFDEVAGNYQVDNFDRGGVGGDHVNVDVQDSYSLPFLRNNANWSPSNEGNPARTNYYLWTDPHRDGAFDGKVIWHEFTHGLSTRLVGGPNVTCLSGPQPGGMGEGWSDWFAISYYSGVEADPAGPETVGEYVTGDYEDGIRRYPYAYDMSVNPLTYADLCDNDSCQVHAEGEIWASALWDVRHDMIQAHGYDDGRRWTEQLVIDAMKLSPCSPNMVEMRDLVVQADRDRFGGANECLLRSAFARRGLGGDAWSNGSGSDAGAGFDIVAPLDASLRIDADRETITWAGRENAIAYPVARGSFDTGNDNLFDNAACVGEATEPTWTDGETPSTVAGFYYLVAVRDGCAESTFGTASDGTPRTVQACP
jgi:hypothetical protein